MPENPQFCINYHNTKLVSFEDDGYVVIKSKLPEKGTIKERKFKDNIADLYSQDYKELDILKREPPYAGCEFKSLPNITVLPNLKTREGRILLGCTMGHYQEALDSSNIEVLEVYEYHGFGAMLIDKKDSPFMELCFLRPGDKVFTLNRCNMTLYNLDLHPLVTADFANSKIHQGDKTLQKEIGPALMMLHDGIRLEIKLNPEYINRDDGIGVRLNSFEPKDLTIFINTILGKDLYDKLFKSEDEFEKLGIHVVAGDKSPSIAGTKLSGCLFDVITKSSTLQNYFRM